MSHGLKQRCSTGTENTNKMGTFKEIHFSVKCEREKKNSTGKQSSRESLTVQACAIGKEKKLLTEDL